MDAEAEKPIVQVTEETSPSPGVNAEIDVDKRKGKRPAPASWSAFISLQAPADQMYLESLDARYFGGLSFANAEERDYLMRAGFPSPEEWLEGRSMTDNDLRRRADTGDPKAAGMYADRMIKQYKDLVAINDLDPNKVSDAERVHAATMAVWYASQTLDRQPEFGAYVKGMVHSTIYKSWEPMTAAILTSMRSGDPRVERLMAEMHFRHPTQDVQLIHTSMKGVAPRRR